MIQRIKRYVSRAVRLPSTVALTARQVSAIAGDVAAIRREQERAALAAEGADARLGEVEGQLAMVARTTNETVWAEVFHDTIASSGWLKDPSFSPGRWAVGYPYLYVLYRVLDEARPARVLELGLGQSTKMISQYAAAESGIGHTVVEHDARWVEFFAAHHTMAADTELLICDWAYEMHDGVEGVRVYSGLADRLAGERFDLICIDGPLGGDMPEYARIDVLRMLPGILSDSFVIIVDDCERAGEARTLRAMSESLTRAGIGFKRGDYKGNKDVAVLCSLDRAFLCSM